jgi:hypothetical protein
MANDVQNWSQTDKQENAIVSALMVCCSAVLPHRCVGTVLSQTTYHNEQQCPGLVLTAAPLPSTAPGSAMLPFPR